MTAYLLSERVAAYLYSPNIVEVWNSRKSIYTILHKRLHV
jgi:hypothetical protein